MKKVNLYLEDEEYEKLIKLKGNMTWVDFVMQLVKVK
jgi:predicted CopG family antitoxin